MPTIDVHTHFLPLELVDEARAGQAVDNQIGRLDHGYRVRPEASGCRDRPSSYLDRFYYDTITHAARPLSFLVNLVGAERVVYGTDFPFDMGGGAVAEQVAGVSVSVRGREAIAGGNAAVLFRVEG